MRGDAQTHPERFIMTNPIPPASFAWTATEGYRLYPPYANLTGNRLIARGPERFDGQFHHPGDRIEIELPDEAIAELRRSLEPPMRDERIAELIAEGDGFWRPCSGCQESSDGCVSVIDYPYSPVFQCQPGGGCGECGG